MKVILTEKEAAALGAETGDVVRIELFRCGHRQPLKKDFAVRETESVCNMSNDKTAILAEIRTAKELAAEPGVCSVPKIDIGMYSGVPKELDGKRVIGVEFLFDGAGAALNYISEFFPDYAAQAAKDFAESETGNGRLRSTTVKAGSTEYLFQELTDGGFVCAEMF